MKTYASVKRRNYSAIMRKKDGFTLLEVLISVVILSMIITPILAVFTSSLKTTVVSQDMLDGAYIAQDIYEELVASDYNTLLSASAAMALYDADGDGTDDCYVQKTLYPDGVFTDLTPTDSPSYLHINIVDENIKMFGTSGTDDTPNSGTQTAALGDITLTNSAYSKTVSVQVGSGTAMTFQKKYESCPVVVIVNIFKKKVNTQTVALTLIGDTSDVYVVEYARKHNFDEFSCAQLSSGNIYYGVNDHSTTLVHAAVQVFDIEDLSKRTGFMEGTFEVSLS